MLDRFDNILKDASQRLSKAAKDRKLPMQSPVVATADADARIMVLRSFDPENWALRFHTDLRAPKCGVIGPKDNGGSPVGVLFYDKPEKIQIRTRGVGWIETDTALVEQAWQESTNFARRCYLGDGPGAVSETPTSGLPKTMEGVEPSEDQILPARENFAILVVEIRELDWFSLAHTGHRRAQFTGGAGVWQGRWVTP